MMFAKKVKISSNVFLLFVCFLNGYKGMQIDESGKIKRNMQII